MNLNEKRFSLPYQEFVFTQHLRMYESRMLRSAVLKVIKPYSLLYHNHLNDGVRFGYPLIQYKVINGRGAILYLGEGVEQIEALFHDVGKRDVYINGDKISLEIYKIIPRLYHLQVYHGEAFRRYKLTNWLPVQDENYLKFKSMSTIKEQNDFLVDMLKKNILAFAKGIGWFMEGEVKIKNFRRSALRWTSYKNVKFITYDVWFDANVFLPPHIGLGKGAAHNYGVLYPVKQKNHKQYER